jgi:hypothetical protein
MAIEEVVRKVLLEDHADARKRALGRAAADGVRGLRN